MGIRFHIRQIEMQAIERAETERLLEQAEDFFFSVGRRKPIDDIITRRKPKDYDA